jgi:hypothetical protein
MANPPGSSIRDVRGMTLFSHLTAPGQTPQGRSGGSIFLKMMRAISMERGLLLVREYTTCGEGSGASKEVQHATKSDPIVGAGAPEKPARWAGLL